MPPAETVGLLEAKLEHDLKSSDDYGSRYNRKLAACPWITSEDHVMVAPRSRHVECVYSAYTGLLL